MMAPYRAALLVMGSHGYTDTRKRDTLYSTLDSRGAELHMIHDTDSTTDSFGPSCTRPFAVRQMAELGSGG
jgi:hypothetical protein